MQPLTNSTLGTSFELCDPNFLSGTYISAIGEQFNSICGHVLTAHVLKLLFPSFHTRIIFTKFELGQMFLTYNVLLLIHYVTLRP